MIHDLDILYYLLEDSPFKVKAKGFKTISEKWDHVEARFSYPKGQEVSIVSSRMYTDEVRRIDVTNKLGTLTVDLLNTKLKVAYAKKEGKVEVHDFEKRDHLLMEHKTFYQSISKKLLPPVGLEEGIEAVKNVEAVLKVLDGSD